MTSQRDNYKDLTKTISVDSQNRITQVQDALSTTIGNYWYDEGGFRVRKKALVPSGAGFKNQEILYPSKFYGLEYAEDTNVLSSINNVYLNGVRIAALNEEGTAAYFLTDQVDSVAHVLDEGAHTLSRMQYEPYGETLVQRGTLDFAPKYNSQELDRETNFYFYNARYYDPQIARFTSADAVIDGARSTQGWNRFAYVKGNPVGAKDPTGHTNFIIGGAKDCGNNQPCQGSGRHSTVKNYKLNMVKLAGLKDTPADKIFRHNNTNIKYSRPQSFKDKKVLHSKAFNEISKYHKENPKEPIDILGHSWGGNGALQLWHELEEAGISVNSVHTFDPVSRFKTNTKPKAAKGEWNNYIPDKRDIFSPEDIVSLVGGEFGVQKNADKNFEVKVPDWYPGGHTGIVRGLTKRHLKIKPKDYELD